MSIGPNERSNFSPSSLSCLTKAWDIRSAISFFSTPAMKTHQQYLPGPSLAYPKNNRLMQKRHRGQCHLWTKSDTLRVSIRILALTAVSNIEEQRLLVQFQRCEDVATQVVSEQPFRSVFHEHGKVELYLTISTKNVSLVHQIHI